MRRVVVLVVIFLVSLSFQSCQKQVCPAYQHLYESDAAGNQKRQLKAAKKNSKRTAPKSGLVPRK